jgi:tRNA A-37 threonylcarbamoyl transferase component Bud32
MYVRRGRAAADPFDPLGSRPMSAPPCEHPAPSDLEAFGLGLLDPSLSDVVEKHVAGCDSCCQAVQGVADDTLVNQLRDAATLSDLPPAASGATAAWKSSEVPNDLARHPRYRILKLLGCGGMGAVYQAEHGVMRRRVALKVIKPEYTANAASVERFRREIQAAARLNHPNIVAAYDAEQAGETHFLVMEYVEGVSLDQVVMLQGPLPVAEACDAVRQAALGLQHAHEHGMVHRDVKPHNLIRTPDGVVKVLDFGLAAVAEDRGERPLTGTNMVLGTPDYIAPEQAEDTRAADARSDVYSLGCTLYHLLTGRPPFRRPSTLLTILAHREEASEPVCASRPDVPPALAAELARMMAKAPSDRFQTAAEVANALAPFTVAPAPFAAPRKGKSRRRLQLAVALAAAVVGVLAAAAVVIRINTPSSEVTIETDDPNVELVVTKGGKLVRIVDPQSKQTWELDPEKFTLGMADQPDGLTIELDDKKPFTLKRKGEKLVTVAREQKGPAGKPPAAEGVGEVRRIVWPGHRVSDGMLSFSPDARSLLAAATDDEARVWDLDSGEARFDFRGFIARYLPDGKQIVAADQDGSLKLIDAEAGGSVLVSDRFAGALNISVAPSPYGLRMVTLDSQGWQLWRREDDGRWQSYSWPPAGVRPTGPVIFTQNGSHMLVAVDGKPPYFFHALTNGPSVFDNPFSEALTKKLGMVQQFSLDGRLLFQRDGSDLQTLDVKTGDEVGRTRLEDKGRCLVTFALSRDGERLLAAYEDGSLRLLERKSSKELARFDMKTATPRMVCFSRNGRYAAAASYDGTIVAWRLPGPPADKPAGAP